MSRCSEQAHVPATARDTMCILTGMHGVVKQYVVLAQPVRSVY